LRLDLPEAALVHWSMDGWQTRRDTQTRDTGLGIHTVEIPTEGCVPGDAIVFTWMNLATGKWIGRDHVVRLDEA
jgi:glucoamylase